MDEVEILWLWYDYETEMFDQMLPHTPSERDKGSVIVNTKWQHVSGRHAEKLKTVIFAIARRHSINDEDMMREKLRRTQQTTLHRMETHQWVIANTPEKLTFIIDYLAEQDSKIPTTPTENRRFFFDGM